MAKTLIHGSADFRFTYCGANTAYLKHPTIVGDANEANCRKCIKAIEAEARRTGRGNRK